MSIPKATLLVFALVAAAAVVFFVSGADQLIASSAKNSTTANVGDGQTASSGSKGSCSSKSSCTKTAAAGCPGSTSDCAKSCAKSACAAKKADQSASITPIEGHDGTRMVLTGRYVCGYCDLSVAEKCQPAFRTTDGKNYLLVDNNYTKELKRTARDKNVEIVTHVQKYDGVKYLEVDVVRSI